MLSPSCSPAGPPELCRRPRCRKHSSQPCGLASLQALSLPSSAFRDCFGGKSGVSAAEPHGEQCCAWPGSAWGSPARRAEQSHQVPGEEQMQSDIIKIRHGLDKVHRGLDAIDHPQNSGTALKAAASAGGRTGLLRRPGCSPGASPLAGSCPTLVTLLQGRCSAPEQRLSKEGSSGAAGRDLGTALHHKLPSPAPEKVRVWFSARCAGEAQRQDTEVKLRDLVCTTRRPSLLAPASPDPFIMFCNHSGSDHGSPQPGSGSPAVTHPTHQPLPPGRHLRRFPPAPSQRSSILFSNPQ